MFDTKAMREELARIDANWTDGVHRGRHHITTTSYRQALTVANGALDEVDRLWSILAADPMEPDVARHRLCELAHLDAPDMRQALGEAVSIGYGLLREVARPSAVDIESAALRVYAAPRGIVGLAEWPEHVDEDNRDGCRFIARAVLAYAGRTVEPRPITDADVEAGAEIAWCAATGLDASRWPDASQEAWRRATRTILGWASRCNFAPTPMPVTDEDVEAAAIVAWRAVRATASDWHETTEGHRASSRTEARAILEWASRNLAAPAEPARCRVTTPSEVAALQAPAVADEVRRINARIADGRYSFSVPEGIRAAVVAELELGGWHVTHYAGGISVSHEAKQAPTDPTHSRAVAAVLGGGPAWKIVPTSPDPSPAERLTRYRCAALGGLLAGAAFYDKVGGPEAFAEHAEALTHAMLAAEVAK